MLAKSTIDLLILPRGDYRPKRQSDPSGRTDRHHDNCRSADVTILGGFAEFEREFIKA
jgi:hypothetical protein